jgi:hypothetical protein
MGVGVATTRKTQKACDTSGGETKTSVAVAVLLLLCAALLWAGCGPGVVSTAEDGAIAEDGAFIATVVYQDNTDGWACGIARTDADSGAVYNHQYITQAVDFQVEASDPRVSGDVEVTMQRDIYPDKHSELYGTWTLTNSRGTWVCDNWTAAHGSDENEFGWIEASGTGEYEGLTLCAQWHLTCSPMASGLGQGPQGFTMSGWIRK